MQLFSVETIHSHPSQLIIFSSGIIIMFGFPTAIEFGDPEDKPDYLPVLMELHRLRVLVAPANTLPLQGVWLLPLVVALNILWQCYTTAGLFSNVTIISVAEWSAELARLVKCGEYSLEISGLIEQAQRLAYWTKSWQMKLRFTISEADDVALSVSDDSDFLSDVEDIALESDDDVAPVVVLD